MFLSQSTCTACAAAGGVEALRARPASAP
ncbi:hypothetical protein [Paraburkholderia sediminicola]